MEKGNSICLLQSQSKFIADSPTYLLDMLYVIRKAYFILYRIRWAALPRTDLGLLMQLPLSFPFSSMKIPLSCESEAVTDVPLLSPFISIIK